MRLEHLKLRTNAPQSVSALKTPAAEKLYIRELFCMIILSYYTIKNL